MPVSLASLLGGLINIAGTLAGRVLLALGFGFVSYTGATTTLDFLVDQAIASFGPLGADVVGIIAYMKVGECISLVASAMLVRKTLDGLQNGTIKKLVLK